MIDTLKVEIIGNSVGIILSKDILKKLKVQNGDTLYVFETPNGIEISTSDSNISNQIKMAQKVMQEDKEVLRKLAE